MAARSSRARAPGRPRPCPRQSRRANARRPASISNSTQPNAQMSARLSAGWPRACSGSCTRPCRGSRRLRRRRRRERRRVTTCAVDAPLTPASSAFARPKSSTLTVPSGATLMLAGFRSRWMMPCSCAASRASAICVRSAAPRRAACGPLRDAIRERRSLDQLQDQRADAV